MAVQQGQADEDPSFVTKQCGMTAFFKPIDNCFKILQTP